MSLIAKAPENSEFELAPEGNHIAICYMVCDLGDHEQTYQGESKGYRRKVRIAWELCNEEMEDGNLFSVSANYTLSLAPKANLRKHLEGWRGRAFTDQELEGFDLLKVVGIPCMVQVIHTESGDKTYANINGVSSLPKGMDAPELRNDPVRFSLDQFDEIQYQKFPNWLKEKINTKGVNQTEEALTENPAPKSAEEWNDEIPF